MGYIDVEEAKKRGLKVTEAHKSHGNPYLPFRRPWQAGWLCTPSCPLAGLSGLKDLSQAS
jgi:hypothetical protein